MCHYIIGVFKNFPKPKRDLIWKRAFFTVFIWNQSDLMDEYFIG